MVRNILYDLGTLFSDKQFNSFWVLYMMSCGLKDLKLILKQRILHRFGGAGPTKCFHLHRAKETTKLHVSRARLEPICLRQRQHYATAVFEDTASFINKILYAFCQGCTIFLKI
jgi:hypothetical protein